LTTLAKLADDAVDVHSSSQHFMLEGQKLV